MGTGIERVTATPCPAPTQDPQPDPPSRTMPARIAAMLHTVRIMLGFGRHLAETAKERSASTDFNAIAVCFGTSRLYAISRTCNAAFACRRAGARVARARSAGPGYPVRLPARARDDGYDRDRDTTHARRSAGRRATGRAIRRAAGRRAIRRGAQRAEGPRGRPARSVGTTPNSSCRHRSNSRRRCAAARSAAPLSISASTWR